MDRATHTTLWSSVGESSDLRSAPIWIKLLKLLFAYRRLWILASMWVNGISFSLTRQQQTKPLLSKKASERVSERKKTFAINSNKSWNENDFCWFFMFVNGGWIFLLYSSEGQRFMESEKTSAVRKLRSQFDREAKRGGMDRVPLMDVHTRQNSILIDTGRKWI